MYFWQPTLFRTGSLPRQPIRFSLRAPASPSPVPPRTRRRLGLYALHIALYGFISSPPHLPTLYHSRKLKDIKNPYKISRSKRYKACSDMVEMGGVEPPSESTLTGTSPSAYGQLHSLPCAPAVRLAESVASLCVVRSKLCALTGTTDRRSVPGRGPPGGNAR